MDLLSLLLLIQVVFFVSKGKNHLIILLILLSVILSYFDKRKYVFIGLSMIISQIVFLYMKNNENENTRESFKFKMKKAKKFMKKNAKYGLLAAGPTGAAAFVALEANERRKKNKKKRKAKKRRNRAKTSMPPKQKPTQNTIMPKTFNGQMDLHMKLHKQLDNTMKNHVNTINNIHKISA